MFNDLNSLKTFIFASSVTTVQDILISRSINNILISYLRKADQYELINHHFPSSVSLVKEKVIHKVN